MKTMKATVRLQLALVDVIASDGQMHRYQLYQHADPTQAACQMRRVDKASGSRTAQGSQNAVQVHCMRKQDKWTRGGNDFATRTTVGDVSAAIV